MTLMAVCKKRIQDKKITPGLICDESEHAKFKSRPTYLHRHFIGKNGKICDVNTEKLLLKLLKA